MQGTADFHHHIAEAVFPHPERLLQYTAAFDTAIDMCDMHSAPSKLPIVCFLLGDQLLPHGCFVGWRMATPASVNP